MNAITTSRATRRFNPPLAHELRSCAIASEPGGFAAISRWSPKAHHRKTGQNESASLRDTISTIPCFRWCRFAQPPANRCDPSELNRKCATSKLTLRVIKEVLKQLLPLCLQKHEPGDVTPPGSCFFRPRSLSISHLALFQMADTQQRRSFTRT